MGKTTKYIEDGYESFVVDDDTGVAYVDPDGADLLLTSGDEVTVEGGEEPPAYVREFLDRETDLDPVHRRTRRYKEVRIGVGDPVLVAGQASPDGIGDRGTTTAITERGDGPRFYVTDDPGHGLGRRLLNEAFVFFLIAAILFTVAYFLVAT
jgi:hypothetical protein